jgi:dihydrofolate reductase
MLYIAMSLDGYIAQKDDGLDWLSDVERTGEDYGYGEFTKSVDTVIIGRRTYDAVVSMGVAFPHSDKECYIITRNARPAEGNLTFYDQDLKELVVSLKKKKGGIIFVDGGAEIVNTLLRYELFDEYIVSIIPIFLGDGIALFNGSRPEEKLDLVSAKHFESGLVQLHYQKRNEKIANR